MKISNTAISSTGAVPSAHETVFVVFHRLVHRALLEFALEPAQAGGPGLGVLAHPSVMDEPDRDRVEEVELLASAPARGHEPCLLEHLEVLHHAEARHRRPLLERAERLPILGEEPVEQFPSRRVGECLEDRVHAGNDM